MPFRAGTLESMQLLHNQSYMTQRRTLDTMKPSEWNYHVFKRANRGSLSIARIFGGFPAAFFKTYHEYIPKCHPAEQYDLRMHLYELFHYLNHTLLFGVCCLFLEDIGSYKQGNYAQTAASKIDLLLA